MPDHLQALATMLMDIRGYTNALEQAVTNAQANIEQFRHIRSKDTLNNIARCLAELVNDSHAVTDGAVQAEKALIALMGGIPSIQPSPSSDPSGV